MKKYLVLSSLLIGLLLFGLASSVRSQSSSVDEARPATTGTQDAVAPRRQVMVIGRVFHPGIVELGRVTTVTDAIAAAGGDVKGAHLDRVSILRAVPNSLTRQAIKVDLRVIRKGRADDVLLVANDIVDVPPTYIPGKPVCIFY